MKLKLKKGEMMRAKKLLMKKRMKRKIGLLVPTNDFTAGQGLNLDLAENPSVMITFTFPSPKTFLKKLPTKLVMKSSV